MSRSAGSVRGPGSEITSGYLSGTASIGSWMCWSTQNVVPDPRGRWYCKKTPSLYSDWEGGAYLVAGVAYNNDQGFKEGGPLMIISGGYCPKAYVKASGANILRPGYPLTFSDTEGGTARDALVGSFEGDVLGACYATVSTTTVTTCAVFVKDHW